MQILQDADRRGMGMSIRYPAVAGTFYPDDKDELSQMINEFLSAVDDSKIDEAKLHLPGRSRLRGIVVPHAGYEYSGPIAAYGYKALAKYKGKVTRAVVMGPAHFVPFNGACESGHDFWQTPLGDVKIDRISVSKSKNGQIGIYPEAHEPEHSIEVQLPFIQTVLGNDVEAIPLLCGDADPKALAKVVEQELDDRTIVIASSDLSHYKPYAEAVKTDKLANETVPSLDIERFMRHGDACGHTPILTLMHIAKSKGWTGRLLDYRNSGDTAGPKTQVVGYGCYAFYG